jgi:hypothetical protein
VTIKIFPCYESCLGSGSESDSENLKEFFVSYLTDKVIREPENSPGPLDFSPFYTAWDEVSSQ